MLKLLIATNNAGKIAEFHDLLSDCGWELVTPSDIGLHIEPAEDGSTFEENARQKALQYASASTLAALADDSGIEVDALDGRPGIHSARYAGNNKTDEERVQKLLEELRDVPDGQRTARFRAVIAIAHPNGRVETADGTVEGVVAGEPRGANGFGYDPIFLLPDRGLTTAELPAAEKHAISHRGIAARKARKILERWAHDLSVAEGFNPQRSPNPQPQDTP